jgi:hypothetical protein
MQTREVTGHLSLRSRSRCRCGSAGDLLRIGLRSGQQGTRQPDYETRRRALTAERGSNEVSTR